MTEPTKGIEVTLREFGCPYGASDRRTGIWLDGFRKGQASGFALSEKIVRKALDEAGFGQ